MPAELADAEKSLGKFEGVISTRFWQAGDCKRMIQEGWIEIVWIRVNGVPTYLLGFHLTDDAGLWVDILQQTHPVGGWDLLSLAIDHLARQRSSRYIRFYTARRALATYAREYGYRAEAVLLTKKVVA